MNKKYSAVDAMKLSCDNLADVTPETLNDFLIRKEITAECANNAKLDAEKNLLLPMYTLNILELPNPEDNIVGFQKILSNKPLDGNDKQFISGSILKSSYYPIGFKNIVELSTLDPDVLFITESFSNAASLYMGLCTIGLKTNPYIINAFSLSNFDDVLAGCITYFSDAGIRMPQFILVADNDFIIDKLENIKNQGLSKCLKLKDTYSKGDVVIDVFIPGEPDSRLDVNFNLKYDVNDVHINHGLDELARQFNEQFTYDPIGYKFISTSLKQVNDFIKLFDVEPTEKPIFESSDFKLYHNRLEALISQTKSKFEHIGNYIKVTGQTVLENTCYLLLEFHNRNNVQVDLMLARGDLVDVRMLTKILFNAGYEMELSYKSHLQKYLLAATIDNDIVATLQVGWYNRTFILPHKIVGNNNNSRYYGSIERNIFKDKATLLDWQTNIAQQCIGYDILELSLCIGFSSILANFVNFGYGVHLSGSSSTGKTTALHVGSSIFGDTLPYLYKWNATANGIEFMGYNRNHVLCAIDEIHEASKNTLDCIYMLIDGKGRTRATSKANIGIMQVAPKTWRTVVLSSGEVSIEDVALQFGKILKAGELARMIDIKVDKVCRDKIHSEQLVENCSKYHGTASIAFIEYIINNNIDVKSRFDHVSANFVHSYTNLHGQAGRVAKYFALMQLAGELAIEAQILTNDFKPAYYTKLHFDKWHTDNSCDKEIQQTIDKLLWAIDDGTNWFIHINDETATYRPNVIGGYNDSEYYVLSSLVADKLYKKKSFTKERGILQSLGILSKTMTSQRIKFMGTAPKKVYTININELEKYRKT